MSMSQSNSVTPAPTVSPLANTILQHIGSITGTTIMVLTLTGLAQGTDTGLGLAIHNISGGLTQLIIGISGLMTALSVGKGIWSSTRASLIASVAADPKVDTVIVNDKALAQSIPLDNVKAVSQATQNVIDTTAAPKD